MTSRNIYHKYIQGLRALFNFYNQLFPDYEFLQCILQIIHLLYADDIKIALHALVSSFEWLDNNISSILSKFQYTLFLRQGTPLW